MVSRAKLENIDKKACLTSQLFGNRAFVALVIKGKYFIYFFGGSRMKAMILACILPLS